MASPFSFVPRSVKRKQSTAPSTSGLNATVSVSTPRIASTSTATPLASGETRPPAVKDKDKELKTPTPEDLAGLVWLSLSDYALWKDGDLRRRMDEGIASQTPEDDSPVPNDDDAKFVSLSYLVAHSHVFRIPSTSSWTPPTSLPHTSYSKAIRTHASNYLDVRLVLFPTRASTQRGYEVRRKDWRTLDQSIASRGKSRWDALSIYVENIPTQYRTTHGVLRFMTGLLRPSSPFPDTCNLVQHIQFPPHHNDLPSTVPACKGFALVTLGDAEDVEALLTAWAWDRQDLGSRECDGAPAQDAERFGFRTMPKKTYEDRKAEYLAYRQQLEREAAEFDAEEARIRAAAPPVPHIPSKTTKTSRENEPTLRRIPDPVVEDETPSLHPHSPYPPGCLVHVRHIHPSTNKTTLRSLFSRARTTPSSTTSKPDFLDYVDYNKGTDTCYLRVKSPQHTQELAEHFNSQHPVVQTSGLDDQGADASSCPESKPVQISIVSGRPEELYWEKVPEKVRRQAVQAALAAATLVMEGGFSDVESSSRKMKRQKVS